MTQDVLSEVNQGIQTITLNRPDCLNAINDALAGQLMQALQQANADDQVKVVVLQGAGRAFCAGDDLDNTLADLNDNNRESLEQYADTLQAFSRQMLYSDKFMVCAVQGWAVGAGFELVLNCDFSLWGSGARAYFPPLRPRSTMAVM